MSLVGDALRKARADGSRRSAGNRSVPGLPLPGPRSRRSGLGLGLVLGALLTLAASLGGAGLVWLAASRRESAPAAVPAGASAAARPAPASAQGPLTDPSLQSITVPSAIPVASIPGEGSGAPAAPGLSTAATASPGPTALMIASPPREAPASAVREPSAIALPVHAGERVFILKAELGYARLQLDYLVYKPSAPFGRVNGTDIVPGSIVEGFLVEEIGRDFVRLRDSRGPLVLRVR